MIFKYIMEILKKIFGKNVVIEKSQVNRYEIYNNVSGATGTITLSSSPSNFSKIEILYASDSIYGTMIIPTNIEKFAIMSHKVNGTNQLDLFTATYSISSTGLTHLNTNTGFMNSSGGVGVYGTTAYIRIYKVWGYK